MEGRKWSGYARLGAGFDQMPRLEQDKSISEVIACCEGIENKLLVADICPPNVPQPKTPLEALHQRLDKYRAGLESAKAEGNGSKARRTGRILKQYEDAIKNVKAGKPVNFLKLPTRPGFPPIPVGGAAQPARTTPSEVPPVRF